MTQSRKQQHQFLKSLLWAFFGLALLGFSVYLGSRDRFFDDYLIYIEWLVIAAMFAIGVLLVGRYIWNEGGGDFSEQIPH